MSRHKHECVECFDPKTIELIRCVCSLERLVDDVFKCLSCRPNTRAVQQVLTCILMEEVREIETLLTNETFGLSEIKTQVAQIEAIVQAINNILAADLLTIANEVHAINTIISSPAFGLQRIETDVQTLISAINSSVFGLRKIETDVQTFGSNLNSPTFGLPRIETDVQTVISSVNSPVFGLEEIEKQIRAIEKSITYARKNLTTGPVFLDETACYLTVQVQNNTSYAHTVHVKVVRIDKHPFQEVFDKDLEIQPLSTNEFRYISLDIADCCGASAGEIEVILEDLAPGLYPTIAQVNEEDKIIPSSIFKSADFVPQAPACVS